MKKSMMLMMDQTVELRSVYLATLLFFASPLAVNAESIQLDAGSEQVQIVSSLYKKESNSAPYFAIGYGRQLMGRWSGFAEYRNTIDNVLSSGVVGVTYDSSELRIKGGLISGDGTPEISKVPLWLSRLSIGVGVYRLVDILRSNDQSLGSRNLVPVKASLIGIRLGGSLSRFITDNFSVSIGAGYTVATAGNFGVSSMGAHLGGMYYID